MPTADNGVFNLGHEIVEMHRFVSKVGRGIGCRARMLPRWVYRGLCVTMDSGFRACTGTYMSPSLSRAGCYPHEKARSRSGYDPQYSLTVGIAEVARPYRRS